MANLNHVALLVNNIESFIQQNSFSSDLLGKIEEFPSEGTRELYIGKSSHLGRLLLMQAIGEGPYKDTLKKRGAGLHHIAIDVQRIDDFAGELSGSGWLLHPKSLWFYDDNKQIFLARPEVPVLIEVQEKPNPTNKDYFINSIELPFPNTRLVESLCCPRIKMGKELKISCNGKSMSPVFD